MVKQQTEPDVDPLAEQERRLRRGERDRKVGAYALVAALAIGTIVFVVDSGNDDRVATPAAIATDSRTVAPAPVLGFATYDLDTGSLTATGIVASSSAVDVSRDGTKMAYIDSHNGSDVVHVANVDGSDVQAFDRTGRAGEAKAPRWSPDGTKIVYQGKPANTDEIGNLYVLDVTTGAVERITDLAPIPVGVWWMAPVFSADGQSVYFNKARGESTGVLDTGVRWDLWSVPASGGEPTLVHKNGFMVDVSPTGHAIAYLEALNVHGAFTTGDLYVARLDGSAARKVADGPAENPRFSPDGSQLAYGAMAGSPSWTSRPVRPTTTGT